MHVTDEQRRGTWMHRRPNAGVSGEIGSILPGVTFTYVAVVAVQLAVLLALWWSLRAFLLAPRFFRMHPLDWLIIVGYLSWILYDGIKRAKGTHAVEGYFLASRRAAVVGCRSVGHGHPDECYHAGRDHGPGIRGRRAVRAVLFRSAGRHDHPVADARPVLPSCAGLHGVRVPREAVRCEDASPRQFPLLCYREGSAPGSSSPRRP